MLLCTVLYDSCISRSRYTIFNRKMIYGFAERCGLRVEKRERERENSKPGSRITTRTGKCVFIIIIIIIIISIFFSPSINYTCLAVSVTFPVHCPRLVSVSNNVRTYNRS